MSPEKFIDTTNIQRNITQNILDNIFQNVEWNQSGINEILDVGCGPGNVTREVLMPKIPGNFRKLIGVDIRDSFLAYGKNKYSDDRVEFIKMDIETGVPPDYERRFDLVTSFYCLHLLNHEERAVEIMGKCIKPGGHFILTYEFHKHLDDFYYKMSKNPKWSDSVTASGPTVNQIHDLKQNFFTYIENEGFDIIYDELKHCETPFNRRYYIESLKHYNPFDLPKKKQKEFYSCMVDNYVNEGLTADQAKNTEIFMSKYTLMVILAKKVT